MNKVKVDKLELIVKVKENRNAHKKVFEKAINRYREQVICELEKSISLAKEGKRIRTQIYLPEPIDQTKEYDRALAMLEMSVDLNFEKAINRYKVVELTKQDFAQLVLDDWSWKDSFTSTVSNYLSVEEIERAD